MGTDDPGGTAKKRARPGRKYGTLRDHSQEYNTLARFLRDRMAEADLTVADLLTPTGLGRSAVSERLAGSDKLDAKFVDAVVVACTRARELLPRRARLRTDAARLLSIAQQRATPVPDLTRQPPAVRNTVLAAMDGASKAQEELLDVHRELRRKSDELEGLAQIRYESQLALNEATALSSHLATVVIVLANEVERLTLERELTMTAQPPDLARLTEVDMELTNTVTRHDRTARSLEGTEQDRKLATQLLAETVTRTRRVRHEMRRLQAVPDGIPSETSPPTTLDAFTTAPPIDGDIDAALDLAEAVGRRIADRLRGALTVLDPDAETGPLSDTPAADNADNADNAVTGADTADNTLWWDMMIDVPTPAFTWAEQTAIELLRGRDPHDPRFVDIARTRPVRETLLLADRLRNYRWTEGSARLSLALARSLDVDQLAPLLSALSDAGGFLWRRVQGARMLNAAVYTRLPWEVAALHRAMPGHQAFGLVAQRPYADVAAVVRELLVSPRDLAGSEMFKTVVREWPSANVVELATELLDVEDGAIGFLVFTALPVPPVDHTELLVRLRADLDPKYFVEMLPTLYRQATPDLARHIAALHGDWLPPLDRAAEQLMAEVMPQIVGRTTLRELETIGERLERLGLPAVKIFAPYGTLFGAGSPPPPVSS